jgi:hypothetical protein
LPKGHDLVRIVAMIGQVVAAFAFWELLSHRSQIGIEFLYAIPVTCAGWWYGRRAGAAAAFVRLVIYVFSAAGAGVPTLAASDALRGLVLLGVEWPPATPASSLCVPGRPPQSLTRSVKRSPHTTTGDHGA